MVVRAIGLGAICALLAVPGIASGAAVKADFNGDGRSDLAVGVPREDLGTASGAGVVHVFYGSASGLTTISNQFLHQDTPGIAGTAASGDFFGSAVSAGDFNGDDRADLAVGAPGENVGAASDGGVVHVLFGSAGGLTSTADAFLHQDAAGIEDAAEPNDSFGSALTSGNFNGSGPPDLAIGAPGEDIGTVANAGAVNAIYGSASGLTTAGNQFIHQDTTGVVDAAEPDDAFGSALTAGDFNIDTRVNLAVGVPGEDIGSVNLAGAVSVINGSASGLTQLGDQFFNQDSSGVLDAAEPDDGFGSAVAAGNFNGQGGPDLAVGVSFEDVGSINAAGAVNVIYSSPSGLSATGNQFFHQNATGILDAAELFDRFGSAVATGDFNGDNRADLAVGAFGEDVGNRGLAGAVHVIYGATGVLTTAGNQFLHQDTAGIADAAEIGDRFGSALAAGTFNDGAQADLAIGVPEEHIGLVQNAGALNAIYGSASGLTATGDQFFSQNTSGIPDSAEQDDNFGAAVASR